MTEKTTNQAWAKKILDALRLDALALDDPFVVKAFKRANIDAAEIPKEVISRDWIVTHEQSTNTGTARLSVRKLINISENQRVFDDTGQLMGRPYRGATR